MFGVDSRAARAAWTVFLIALAVAAAYLARETLFIVVLAIFLAYAVNPAVHALQRHAPRLSRPVAAGVVFLALLGIIAALSVSIGGRMNEQSSALLERLPDLLKDPQLANRVPLPEWLEPLRARIVQAIREQLGGSDHTMSFARRFATSAGHFASNVLYIVIVPILAFLIVKDTGAMREGILRLFAASRDRAQWEVVFADLDIVIASYIRALLLLSVATFCAYAIALSLMKVPYALVLAALAAPLEFVPVLGPLAAAVIALLVAGFSGYEHLLWITLFIIAYRILQDYVIAPYLMGGRIEIHPAVVIVGILAGEEIAGIAGMFLAVPLIAALKVILEHSRRTRTARAGASSK